MTTFNRSTIFFLFLNTIIINEMVAFAAFQVSSSVKPMFYQRKLSSSSDTSTSTTLHLQSIPSTHSSTVLSYKNTDDDDDNSVKEVVIKKKRRVVSSTPIKNLFAVDTMEDYAEFMEQHKTDLVVIRFFAPWCKVSFIYSFIHFLSFHLVLLLFMNFFKRLLIIIHTSHSNVMLM